MSKLIVKGIEIRTRKIQSEDYICLSDMLKAKDGEFFITDWLRNRNTLEFLGIWERISNPNFNYGEFARIRSQAGLNSFDQGMPQSERLLELNRIAISQELNRIAISQMKTLLEIPRRNLLADNSEDDK